MAFLLTSVVSAVVLLLALTADVAESGKFSADIPPEDCGYFKEVKKGDTGNIKSPNYPSNYPNKALCIWLLEAPIDWRFEMTIPSMDGEEGGNSSLCNDYVEVRSGSSNENVKYYSCNSTTSETFRSKSRWIWVKFESDERNRNTGFKAQWRLVKDKGNLADVNPVPRCRPSGRGVSLECANKECVPWAYVCDSENDCGCTGPGCDESNELCQGLGLSQGFIIGIGITIGFVVFFPIFFGIGLVDIYLKKKAEKDLEKKMKEAKLRDKQKKMGALVVGSIPAGHSRPSTAVKKKA